MLRCWLWWKVDRKLVARLSDPPPDLGGGLLHATNVVAHDLDKPGMSAASRSFPQPAGELKIEGIVDVHH